MFKSCVHCLLPGNPVQILLRSVPICPQEPGSGDGSLSQYFQLVFLTGIYLHVVPTLTAGSPPPTAGPPRFLPAPILHLLLPTLTSVLRNPTPPSPNCPSQGHDNAYCKARWAQSHPQGGISASDTLIPSPQTLLAHFSDTS